jgi:hypothetical protein
MVIAISVTTIDIVEGIAFRLHSVAVETVKQAFLSVASLIADTVLEHLETR